jgi:hypothetical protein
MSDNIWKMYRSEVSRYGNDYTVRYYDKNGGECKGRVRMTYVEKGGKIVQKILLYVSVDINEMIGELVGGDNVEMGEEVVKGVKEYSKNMVMDYIIRHQQ